MVTFTITIVLIALIALTRPLVRRSALAIGSVQRQLNKGAQMTFDDWLRFGIDNKYCSDQFCVMHDAYPMHESEEAEMDEGHDPCAHMVRLGSPSDWDISTSAAQ